MLSEVELRLVVTSLVVLLFAPCLWAQQPSEDSAARRQLADKGMRKITIGIVLLAAGAFVVPITSEPAGRKGPGQVIGIPLIAAGIGFTVAGLRDRDRAVRPSVTVSAAVGSKTIVQISRSW
jgi:hypothetical protein